MDVATILAVTCVTAALQGGLIVTVWLREPDMSSLLWWGVGFLATALGLLLVLARGAGAPPIVGIVLAVALLTYAYGAYWQGLRSFDGEHVWGWSTFVGPAIWLAACTSSSFFASQQARIVLFSLLALAYSMLCARQAWLGRHEPLPSRRLIFALWCVTSLMFAVRVPFSMELGFPDDLVKATRGLLFHLVALFNLLALNIGGLLALTLAHERRLSARLLSALVTPMRDVLPKEGFDAAAARLLALARDDNRTTSLLLISLGRPHLIGAWDDNTRSCFAMRQLGSDFPAMIHRDSIVSCFGYATLACLMPRTEPAEARQIADRICRSFAEIHGGDAKSPPKVAMRFGVASTAEAGHHLRELVEAADAELRGRGAPSFWIMPTPASY